jgi:P-type Cu+ transporter
MNATAFRTVGWGLLALGLLLAVYLGVLTALSGWRYALSQFSEFWVYIIALAAGFGVQVSLYTALRQVVTRSRQGGAVLAVSGTTSGAAMLSCCAHYLVNVAPLLGAAGLISAAAQFQVQLFWIGMLFNAGGIAYVGNNLFRASREHAQCVG